MNMNKVLHILLFFQLVSRYFSASAPLLTTSNRLHTEYLSMFQLPTHQWGEADHDYYHLIIIIIIIILPGSVKLRREQE